MPAVFRCDVPSRRDHFCTSEKKLRVREEEEQKKAELQSAAAAQHVPHVMRG